MDELQPDRELSFWTVLSKKLQPLERPSGGLRIGQQGVYLIDRSENIATFRLVPWQQVLSGDRKPLN